MTPDKELCERLRRNAGTLGKTGILGQRPAMLEAATRIEALTKANAELVAKVERGKQRKFKLGDRVTKIAGSSWTGHVVGFYSTTLTPIGYDVESENEPGSVQLYPETALRFLEQKESDR